MTRQKLNIGITCYHTYGGSGVVASQIGMAMARRGHKVHFICYDVPLRLDRFRENLFFHEVEVHDYPLFIFPPYALSLASKMVEVCTYEKLDLLHVHYAVPHATSAYLAKQVMGKGSAKIITTLHGTDITLVGNDRSYLPITRFSITESDGVTAPSLYLKHATYDKLNVATSTAIEVIPNFVNAELFQPLPDGLRVDTSEVLCRAGCCSAAEKIITHVSNFRPVKRLADVVHVFARVCRQMPAHLILVGDGPERSRIEALVRELGLVDKVCFLGKQETFANVLQASDLFLLPSETESFGLSALEAMACGVPVIASNIHGIPEVVLHGETGFLSAVGDVDDMARNALLLLQDDSLRDRMSKAARSRAVANFEETLLIDRYEAFYYTILETRP